MAKDEMQPAVKLFPTWIERLLMGLLLVGTLGALGVWHRVGLMEERQLAYRETLSAKLEALEARFDAKLAAMETKLLSAIEARDHRNTEKEKR